jgi:energy-coupling factor transporter ATP-binding protein EcfA2
MVDPVTASFAWAGMAAVGKLAWNGMRSLFGSKQPKTNPVMDELERRANKAETDYKAAKDDLVQAKQGLADLNKDIREGIQPEVHPSQEEITKVKHDRQYGPHNIHFAIAGNSGGGKSSLVNAIRGLANNHRGLGRVAPTGAVETTKSVDRYPMADIYPGDRRVWYDVPGAGTLTIPEWQYFNSQGLFIFDAIIVVFDNRFTQSDLAILEHSARFKIPTFIVRSKSEVHIDNIMKSLPGYPDDDDDDVDENIRAQYFPLAYSQYVEQTRASVAENLRGWESRKGREKAPKLADKRVYLVSKGTLMSIVNEKPLGRRKIPLDERDLLEDLAKVVISRRF